MVLPCPDRYASTGHPPDIALINTKQVVINVTISQESNIKKKEFKKMERFLSTGLQF